MKKLNAIIYVLLALFIATSLFFLYRCEIFSPNNTMSRYDSLGNEYTFNREEVYLDFQTKEAIERAPDNILIKSRSGIEDIIPSMVSLGYKIITDEIEKEKKKYTAEYKISNSFIESNPGDHIPAIVIKRDIDHQSSLLIQLKPFKINDTVGYVYYISEFELSSSKAKTKEMYNLLDYMIALDLYFIKENKKVIQKLSPLVLKYVGFGKLEIRDKEWRTEVIPFLSDAEFAGAYITLTESNPYKVTAENILSKMETYQSEIQEFLKYLLKKILEDQTG